MLLAKKLLPPIMLVALVVLFVGSTQPLESYAAAGVDKKLLTAQELIEQFTKTCGINNFDRGTNGEKGFAKNIRNSDYEDKGFWGYFGDQYITVGYNNEKTIGFDENKKQDGIISCRDAFHFIAATTSGKSRTDWLKELYDTSKYVNGNEYKNRFSDNISTEVFRRFNDWSTELKSKSGWNESNTQFNTANIVQAFNKCWKFTPPSGASESEKTMMRQEKTNWTLQLDGGDNAVVSAGYRVEIAVQGNYGDGNANCNDLWDWAKENNKLGANPLENEEDAVRKVDIITLLNSDTDKTSKCISLIEMLKDNDLQDAIDIFAELLVNGPSAEMTAADPEIAAQIEAAKKCILDEETGFGDELAVLINEPTSSTPDNGEVDSGGAGSTNDDCLANTDQFLGWFACPVINLIDSVMEKIEDIIQGLLRFDLNTQDKDGGLRESWNIFRTLATILIMVGFLLALLVKGIKGE